MGPSSHRGVGNRARAGGCSLVWHCLPHTLVLLMLFLHLLDTPTPRHPGLPMHPNPGVFAPPHGCFSLLSLRTPYQVSCLCLSGFSTIDTPSMKPSIPCTCRALSPLEHGLFLSALSSKVHRVVEFLLYVLAFVYFYLKRRDRKMDLPVAGLLPKCSQEQNPGTPSRSPLWMARTQAPALSQDAH